LFLNSKILLYILAILVLLITSCQFNEEKKETYQTVDTIIEKTPHKPIKNISDDGIFIIDKNWDTKKLDSILVSKPEFQIIEKEKDLLFITNNLDSIQISQSNISRKNPIIVFNHFDGPILTSLDRLDLYLITNDKAEKITNNTSQSDSIIKVLDKKNPITKQKLISNKIVQALKLNTKQINLITRSRKLPKIKVGEISHLYPVIPDKKSLTIYFDNDFWDYTDYYYTNGIRIGFTHPVFSNSPLSYLLVTNAKNGLDYYGLHLIQNMYTGSKTKVDTTIPGDRPWAAYSYVGQYATSFDWDHKIKHESEMNIGILGPKSGGGFVQNLVHTTLPNNSPPEGWNNQIKTDIIIDYQYRIYKSLYESHLFESYIKASVQGGSLRDNIKWGLGAKYGIFTPFYKDFQNQVCRKGKRKIYYSIFGDIETQLIGYDATLQGGVTDRTSVYVIPTRNMERFVIQGFLGLEFTYRKIHLQFIQYWKSKEFKTGKDHKYVSTRLFIGF